MREGADLWHNEIMKRLLLSQLIFPFLASAHAGVYFYPNSQPTLEVKCKDGRPDHYIEIKPGRILELEGHKTEYFRNPALHPFNVNTVVNDLEIGPRRYKCSHRKLTQVEADSYREKAFNACLRFDKKLECKGWNY